MDEACEMVKAGFEYITGEYNDGGKIFRKRKRGLKFKSPCPRFISGGVAGI